MVADPNFVQTFVPALHNEIAAVAPILGVSVGDYISKATWRIDFDPSATDEQKAAANAVMAAFDPRAPANNPVRISGTTLLDRLTDAEYTAILAANLSAAQRRWINMAASKTLDLNDQRTLNAKAALVSAGLLTQARADVVFLP